MSSIKLSSKGDLKKTTNYLEHLKQVIKMSTLDRYGKEGVSLLASATPVDTGETSKSWSYEIKRYRESVKLVFKNSNIQNGVPIALVIQYGHATRNGGYIQGRDYINPVVRPLFDKMASDLWEEVTKA